MARSGINETNAIDLDIYSNHCYRFFFSRTSICVDHVFEMLPTMITKLKNTANITEYCQDNETMLIRYRSICELCCICYTSVERFGDDRRVARAQIKTPMITDSAHISPDARIFLPWLSQSQVRCALHQLLIMYITLLRKTYTIKVDDVSEHIIGNFRVCTELFECLLHSITTCYQYTAHFQSEVDNNVSSVYNELCDAKELLYEYSVVASNFVLLHLGKSQSSMSDHNVNAEANNAPSAKQSTASVNRIIIELSVLAEKYSCYKTMLETLLFLNRKEKLYHLMRIVGGDSNPETSSKDDTSTRRMNEQISFANFVIQFMLDMSSQVVKSCHTFIMDLPTEFDDAVYRHISVRSKDNDNQFLTLKWMHEVKCANHAAAADTLNEISKIETAEMKDEEDRSSLSRQECLQKIAAKLATLTPRA